jgi:mycothiol system anti-sigma-R factor
MSVINFGQRPCERIQSYMDSYLSKELPTEANHEMLRHLDTCADCAQALEDRMRVRKMLRSAVESESAPVHLRERIRKEIRTTRTGFHFLIPGANWAFAVAASLFLLLSGWAGLRIWNLRTAAIVSEADEKILKVGVSDHVTCAVDHGMYRKRFTFEQMSGALGPEYAGLVSLVNEKVPADYEIVVAHRCTVNQRNFVHLIMTKGASVVSLVVTKKSGEAFPESGLDAALRRSGISLHQAQLQRYEVAGFETRDHLAFVVSNLPKAANLELASNLAPGVSSHLASLELQQRG